MNISIRKFLLINLLLAITITTSLTAVGNYYLDKQDIQNHLDTLLSQAGLSFEALIGDDLKNRNLVKIQAGLNEIPVEGQKYLELRENHRSPYDFEIKYQFQLWDNAGHLLLRSPEAPQTPLASLNEIGFSDKIIDSQRWRVFTTVDDNNHLHFIVAERYTTRDELAHQITQDDIYIMLLTYPLSGFLIWIIIGRGLSSVRRVADEVGHRAPNYLEPVDIHAVPIEIKPLIDELNKLFLRLQQAFEREKRFAADAAHELRTPLAAIKTQAQVALKTSVHEEQQVLLQNVIAGVDRSAHVVQQLLTLSRLLPEITMIEDASEVNLPKLTTEVVAQLVPLALDKNIDIELDTQNQNTTVLGNATALSILIRNLVDNAIRYTPNGGVVRVTILSKPGHVILKVVDNGPGIPVELRSRVFERFFRVLGNTSSGSGLGLAIVAQIAKLHNAQVKLGTPPNGTGLEIEVNFAEYGVSHR